MKQMDSKTTTLAPPGDGISTVEMVLLNHFIKPLRIRNTNVQGALARLRKSASALTHEVDGVKTGQLTQRVLVPRPWFVEDSSRNWSIALLFRHLAIVNTSITKAIANGVSLDASRLPSGKDRVAAVKPESNRNDENAILDFQNSVDALTAAANTQVESALKRATIPHPWLGDLTHLQWLWFAGFHQDIHAKHLARIIKGLRGRSYA